MEKVFLKNSYKIHIYGVENVEFRNKTTYHAHEVEKV